MTSRNTSSAKRLYELNCLVPLRESEKIIAIAKKIGEFIEKEKGEIMEAEKRDSAESPGSKSRVWVDKKRLAYPIKNDRGGYYLNSWFKIEPENLAELRRFFKLEKEIIRYEILTESNISSPTPTQDSVKLDEIDSLAARTGRSVEEKPRYQERVKDIKPKPQVAAVKEEKVITEAPKKAVIDQKEIAEVKEELEKPKLKIEQAAEPVKQEAEEKAEPKVEKPVLPARPAAAPAKQAETDSKVQADGKEEKIEKADKKEEAERLKKPKKISLEDLDKRLDDILNEEIL